MPSWPTGRRCAGLTQSSARPSVAPTRRSLVPDGRSGDIVTWRRVRVWLRRPVGLRDRDDAAPRWIVEVDRVLDRWARTGLGRNLGERQFEQKDERNYHRIERSYGSFVRSFSLPRSVDASRIAANYRNGVLEIEIPKKEEAKPRQIQINSNKQIVELKGEQYESEDRLQAFLADFPNVLAGGQMKGDAALKWPALPCRLSEV